MPKVGFNLSFIDGHIIFCEKLPFIFSRIEASKESFNNINLKQVFVASESWIKGLIWVVSEFVWYNKCCMIDDLESNREHPIFVSLIICEFPKI